MHNYYLKRRGFLQEVPARDLMADSLQEIILQDLDKNLKLLKMEKESITRIVGSMPFSGTSSNPQFSSEKKAERGLPNNGKSTRPVPDNKQPSSGTSKRPK